MELTTPRNQESPTTGLSRRDALKTLLSLPLATLPGCSSPPPFTGEIVGASASLGHRVRELAHLDVSRLPASEVDVVIVGGGLAGLSAAWRLQKADRSNVAILEVEPRVGGTAASGRSEVTPYPWGAHYVPTPGPDNPALLEILGELGGVESKNTDGSPVFAEHVLCREPEERVFHNGEWHEGLYPGDGASEDDLAELKRFQAEVDHWVAWRDDQQRRAFTLPLSSCSQHDEVTSLDRITMAAWLDEHGFRSPRLRWLVDYSCRDDYGSTIEQTSAWAGLFYFASRQSLPGTESAPLLTWPQGLGRIADHLASNLGDRIHTSTAALRVERSDAGTLHVVAWSAAENRLVRWTAPHVILAIPQFVVPYIVPALPEARKHACRAFEYGSWLVANVHLKDRPANHGFEPAWDNVFHDSRSLGYVTATHQTGRDHGPTVWTWYLPLSDRPPREARQWLQELTWEQASALVVADLETAHPDIRPLIARIDVMKWGHAMVRAAPGFLWGPHRAQAAAPWDGIHFAGTDLSGIPLCEEAVHHGVRAADEVLKQASGIKA
ncbi:protoporphyrinogen oxidase [Caulifigura coniformis]|uniref:Protoporphyrinogen oxidase n=1 Tax=Caulifigura coniformis TaxID=2527983 RepID=A0A517S7T8_9PLAN|nr:FAD-dependent oxidoreductase [Caulifigura coniformis]QDT52211.1 protoporphyrinogen oxidase [Caulifigura coniformis]